MAASTEDWSCDSNKALRVSFVRPDPSQSDLKVVHQWHPKFTYPIFGEEERIFGYKDLDIELQFSAHDCQPHVAISYGAKFTDVGDVKPTDCKSVLQEFMPPPAFSTNFNQTVRNDKRARSFTPPGEKVHVYERGGRKFEVWCGSLSDVNVRNQLDQIQIFVLLLIEGGTILALDDPDWSLDRWQIYYLYEKTEVPDEPNISPYVLAGYVTTYRFYTFLASNLIQKGRYLDDFPDVESIDLTNQSCRLRIAQFVILPPFQSSGHGSELYRVIYGRAMDDETVLELVVEDPSEEFDKLRDAHDWKLLEPIFRKEDIKINTAAVAKQSRFEKMPRQKLLNLDELESIRRNYKIPKRQFYRMVELYFLSQIPYSHRAAGGASLTKLLIKKHRNPDPVDVKYYWLRNIIKSRIWRQNSDKFADTPVSEIVDSISDVSRGQEDEYEGILLHFAAKAAGELNGNSSGGGSSMTVPSRKRKIIQDEDDDEGAASDASKKARSSK